MVVTSAGVSFRCSGEHGRSGLRFDSMTREEAKLLGVEPNYERHSGPVYDVEIDDDDHVFTVDEFKECCLTGGFTNYDGFGYPAKNGKAAKVHIRPSTLEKIPDDATHIVWFNR